MCYFIVHELCAREEKSGALRAGRAGIGKTRMSVAAGIKACSLGYQTKFYTVPELVLKLAEARRNGTLERLNREIKRLELNLRKNLDTIKIYDIHLTEHQ